MGKSKHKWLWIILAGIVLLVGVLSISNFLNQKYEVDYSEFVEIVDQSVLTDGVITGSYINEETMPTIAKIFKDYEFEALQIADVVFDGYVITFKAF